MGKKDIRKQFKPDEKGKSWLLLSLAISFMVCIFAPLEAYYANRTEFWFGFTQILPIVLVVFAVVFCILYLINSFLQKTKWSYAIYGFIFCIMLYFYIQGNYVPRNYGVLNGVDIDWGSYTAYAITSIVLLLVSLTAGIFICLKVKEKIYSAGRLVCTILILMQLVTIGTLYFQNTTSKQSTADNMVVTAKDIFELSENNNVIVFVLDTFGTSVMQDMLQTEKADEYRELFSDFTYYPDTLGAYPSTRGAMPQLLTGEWYTNDKPYDDYVAKAYEDNEIYNILKEDGYSIGVYTEPFYLDSEYSMYTNVEEGSYKIGNYGAFVQKMFKLVAFNYMPHQLKQYFYTTSADFALLKEGDGENRRYTMNVLEFWEILTAEGISLSDNDNSFRVYHTDGVHGPYTFDVNLNSDSKAEYSVYDVAAGNFTILEFFLGELKEKGIYDKSAIIIMADHGSTGYNQNPLFMIKNVNEKHEFKISDNEMSYDYLDDIYLKLLNGEVVEEEDIESLRQEAGQRRFLYYSWDDSWDKAYLPNMVQYVSVGNALNMDNLVLTDNVFTAEKDFSYTLGKELSFGEDISANDYYLYGFSTNGEEYTWTNGTGAAMLFRVNDEKEDLALSMKYHIYGEKQRVKIWVNDNEVANYEAIREEEKVVLIPKEFISDGEIRLQFEFPDAVSPKSRGESLDERILALGIKSMKIYLADEDARKAAEINADKKYALGKEISFGKGDTASKYILGGFSVNEGNYTWTNGTVASMQLEIADGQGDLELIMSYSTYAGAKKVIVSVNGNVVADYFAEGEEIRSIYIPAAFVDDGKILLTFELPDAVSPQSRGESADARELALAMRTLKISVVNK